MKKRKENEGEEENGENGGGEARPWMGKRGSAREAWASQRGGWRKKRGGLNKDYYEAVYYKDHGANHSWYNRPENRG